MANHKCVGEFTTLSYIRSLNADLKQVSCQCGRIMVEEYSKQDKYPK